MATFRRFLLRLVHFFQPHRAESELEREFAASFVRIHRNCLVSRAAIRGFERGADGDDEPHWLVVLDGLEEKLPVSRRQWPTLRELVAEK